MELSFEKQNHWGCRHPGRGRGREFARDAVEDIERRELLFV